MDIKIRKGTKDDVPAALALVKELATYEKEPEAVITTVESMLKDGFSEKPIYYLHVAELDGEVVGIAIYFIMYSTWKGRCLYLDDIVITEKHRRKGIGNLLFDEIVRETKKLNCKQMHWQVLDWNEPAINFYKKYNANLDGEWINGKLNMEQIKNFES
ncbi:MAG: GNAT family N-acetyltransferase [Bacteroidia bacterium]|nr:GNAT family N-acetyltransferase [Bacteroidia bacterium]